MRQINQLLVDFWVVNFWYVLFTPIHTGLLNLVVDVVDSVVEGLDWCVHLLAELWHVLFPRAEVLLFLLIEARIISVNYAAETLDLVFGLFLIGCGDLGDWLLSSPVTFVAPLIWFEVGPNEWVWVLLKSRREKHLGVFLWKIHP